MKMIVSKTLTRADININNLNADTTTAYNPATSYVYNSGTPEYVLVSKAEDNTTDILPARTYELLDDATGIYPPDNPLTWFDLGAVNKDKMFDEFITTKAVADGTEAPIADGSPSAPHVGNIFLNIDVSNQSKIACFGLVGTEIRFLTYDSSSNVIDDTSYSLVDTDSVLSWDDYFFQEFFAIQSIIHEFPIRKVSTMTIEITNTNVGAYPGLGTLVLGRNFFMGKTRGEPTTSILDFSTKERNSFGDLYLNQGLYADELDVDFILTTATFDTVKRSLTAMRGKVTVFDCNNDSTDYASLIILGFYQDFDLIRNNANYSTCSINLESLT